jgi:hypothetical protein
MGRLVLVCVLAGAMLGARAGELPTAAEVLKSVQARMERNYADAPTNRYQYTGTNVIEELDGGGKLKKRSVKTYEVVQVQGLPRAKLVAVDGRELSPSEQRWRLGEEQRLQRTLAQDKAPDYSKPKPWLTDDILERFDFKVVARTNHMRRQALVVEFIPRKDAPSRNMADRVVNRVSGSLWVDELESEIVKLDLHMTEPVKFWGGLVGQLDRFDFTMNRSRSPIGVWFNENASGLVQLRKLFTSTRFKISEQAANFGRERS